jgi:hypothetical protein
MQARTLIEMTRTARFFVRMSDPLPIGWGRAHPDHLACTSGGRRLDFASLASETHLTEYIAFLQAVVRYCEEADWANRIIGYVAYPSGEGATPLACEGYLFDHAPVMQRAFARFLKQKYRSDSALRKAWDDAEVSLDADRLLTSAATRQSVAPDARRGLVPDDRGFRTRGKPVLHWPAARQV